MPLSKVIDKERSKEKVMEFVPNKFPLEITQVISQFREDQERTNSDFRMDDAIKETTGVSELEKQELQDQIEQRALEKLKDVQENAYKEGYDLGRKEGRQSAYQEHESDISDRLERIDSILVSIENLKTELLSFNEAHIIKTLTLMASRLAMKEFEVNPDSVLNVLRKALELSQAEENITVRVSQEELEFIEQLRTETLKDSDPVKKVHLEGDADIKPGGCIIETNYGIVDARIEERLNQLWSVMDENMPPVKDKVETDDDT